MRLALALGRRNLGLTWPNPAVGAVVFDPLGVRIIGTGATKPGGRPHAERVALEAAGESARGATLYVSLEPCSHHGRTPPCAEAVAASGVGRVVTALADPDPRVAGRGHALVEAAGIRLTTGVLGDEATRDHRGHLLRIRERRPATTLKLARTADGYAARTRGPRLMITGEGANARSHMRRAHADAVLVGVGTIIADDPMLDVRLPGLEDRSPVRVVFDTHLRTPTVSRLVRSAAERRTWLVCSDGASSDRETALADAGVRVLRVGTDANGRLDLVAAMRDLAGEGVTRVLCEGGPALAAGLAECGLIDETVLITGRLSLDEPGVPALSGHVSAMLREEMVAMSDEQVGPDRIQVFERKGACSPVW